MSQDRRNWATSALCGGLARVIGRQRGEEGAEYDSYSLLSYCHSIAGTWEYFWPAVGSPLALLYARPCRWFHFASHRLRICSPL